MHDRTKELPSWYTHEQRFVFPATLQPNSRFESVDDIKQLIDKEAARTKLHSGTKGYKLRYEARDVSTGEWRRLRFICVICQTQLNFVCDDKGILTKKINLNHVHGPMQALKRQKELEYKRKYMKERKKAKRSSGELRSARQGKHRKRLATASPNKSRTTKESEYRSPRLNGNEDYQSTPRIKRAMQRENAKQLNSTPKKTGVPWEPLQGSLEFERWLIENKYYFSEMLDSEGEGKQLRLLVVASNIMKKNFEVYGDLLFFEVYPNLFKGNTSDGKSYETGIFTVVDSNNRPLLAGIAIFSQQNVATFRQIFERFVEIHQRHPATITTNGSPPIAEALTQLKSDYVFMANHVTNSWHLAKQLMDKVIGSKQEVARVSYDLNVAIQERQKSRFDFGMQTIREFCQTKGLSDELQSMERQGGFYHSTEGTYVGLFSNNNQQMSLLIGKFISKRMSLGEFLQTVDQLDRSLIRNSKKNFCRLFVDCQFPDSRLNELITMVEAKVAKRFLENYTKAITECSMQEHLSDGNTFMVMSKASGYLYNVEQLNCPCGQLEKTGIACPHIVLASIEKDEVDYTKLIKPRWQKTQSKSKNTQYLSE